MHCRASAADLPVVTGQLQADVVERSGQRFLPARVSYGLAR
jgi:hypothetical protein